MWVAAKDIMIGRGEIRKRGEPVPEAEDWKHRDIWVKARHIIWIPDKAEIRPVEPAEDEGPEEYQAARFEELHPKKPAKKLGRPRKKKVK